jgi:Flp pilus assembly CpaE family ATPase
MFKKIPRCCITVVKPNTFIEEILSRREVVRALENCNISELTIDQIQVREEQDLENIYIVQVTDPLEIVQICEMIGGDDPILVVGPEIDLQTYKNIKNTIFDYHVLSSDTDDFMNCLHEAVSSVVFNSYGKVIGFYPSHGGCGSSSMAHMTACFLSQKKSRQVLVIDLDLSFGVTPLIYSSQNSDSLLNIVRLRNITPETISANVIMQLTNLDSIYSPGVFDISLSDYLDKVVALVNNALSVYDFIILDLPSGWSEIHYAFLERIDLMVSVSTASIKGYRNTASFLESDLVGNLTNVNKLLVVNQMTKSKEDILIRDALEKIVSVPCCQFDQDIELSKMLSPDSSSINFAKLSSQNLRNLEKFSALIDENIEIGASEPQNLLRSRTSIFRKLFGNNKGVVAVEFLLTFPLFFAVFTLISELSLASIDRQSASVILREFNQYAIKTQESELLSSYINDRVGELNSDDTFFRTQVVDWNVTDQCFCGSVSVPCTSTVCDDGNSLVRSIKTDITLSYTSEGDGWLPGIELPLTTLEFYTSVLSE